MIKKTCYCFSKIGVRYVVGAISRSRNIATLDLVLPLSSSLNFLQSPLNCCFYSLVQEKSKPVEKISLTIQKPLDFRNLMSLSKRQLGTLKCSPLRSSAKKSFRSSKLGQKSSICLTIQCPCSSPEEWWGWRWTETPDLIIASLKMEAGIVSVWSTAPVAAEERVATYQVQSTSNKMSLVFCHNEEDAVT